MTWPPSGPTTVQAVIPSYLYWEHSDDPNLQSLTQAYNAYAQAYIDWFNNLNLPIYYNGNIAGTLLDWVLTNLYGFPRPGLPGGGTPPRGDYNSFQFNFWQFNTFMPEVAAPATGTSDDTYKRCATWLFYKGDGPVISTKWVKRRVTRFLNFAAGTTGNIDNTYGVSVTYPSFQHATIKVATSPEALILQAAIDVGVLELPFQISWVVELT